MKRTREDDESDSGSESPAQKAPRLKGESEEENYASEKSEKEKESEDGSTENASEKSEKEKESEDRSSSDEEDEDDEDEDEEDEEAPRKGVKRGKRLGGDVRQFLDTEAEVDDAEDDEEDDDGDYAADGFLADERDEAKALALATMERAAHRTREALALDELTERTDTAELNRQLQERYRGYFDDAQGEAADEDELNQMGDVVSQQRNLPTWRDPNLFLVRCTAGKERVMVSSLLQKHLALLGTKDEMQIRSALCSDSLKGYFYVEASKESHVKDAIRGLHLAMESGMRLVPLKEMVSVLQVPDVKSVSLEPGDWVRVRRGLYKDDLAQVFEISSDGTTATVRLVPRVDLKAGAAAPAGGAEDETGKRRGRPASAAKTQRPPPHILLENEAEAVFGDQVRRQRERQTGKNFYTLDGEKFKKGFLLRQIRTRALLTENVHPTLEEIQLFHEDVDPGDDPTFPELRMPKKPPTSFVRGDVVRVVEGEFRNLVAVVVEEHGQDKEVVVDPVGTQLEGRHMLKFSPAQLRRHFNQGDHVRVISGRHKGESGMVLKVEGEVASLYSDITNKELDVFADDIQKSALVGAGNVRLGQFSLHDLVSFVGHEVGMIVRIEASHLIVLDLSGKTHRCAPADLTPLVVARKLGAFDSNQRPIHVGDPVTVVDDGPYRGKKGTIKHIYRFFAFVKTLDVIENTGIIVVKASQLMSAASSTAARRVGGVDASSPAFAPQSPGSSLQRRTSGSPGISPGFGGASPAQGAVGRGAGRGRGGRGGDLWRKAVVITRGEWKGLRGVVVADTDAAVRVELHARPKTVAVSRTSVKVVDTHAESSDAARRSEPTQPSAAVPFDVGGTAPVPGVWGSTSGWGESSWGRSDFSAPASSAWGAAPDQPAAQQSRGAPPAHAQTPNFGAPSAFGQPTSVAAAAAQTPAFAAFSAPSRSTAQTPAVAQTPAAAQSPALVAPTPAVPQSPGMHLSGAASSFAAPTPSFAAPTPSFAAPTPSFAAPTPSFAAPTPSFAAPAPDSMRSDAAAVVEDAAVAWQMPDIEVRLNESIADLDANTLVVIRDVGQTHCTVEPPDGSASVRVPRHMLSLVEPKVHDTVRILEGASRGALYLMVGHDEVEKCLLKSIETNSFSVQAPHVLGRYVAP